MSAQRRHRLLWILAGVILLVGSAVGARFVLTQNGNGTSADQSNNTPLPDDISFVGVGFVDNPAGVAKLYPAMVPGRINWVIPEGSEVKKGDVLLKLEKDESEIKVKRAKAALAAAKTKKAEAGLAIDQVKFKHKQQEAALQAAKEQKAIAENELAKVEKLINVTGGGEFDKRIAEAYVKKAQAGISAEENKLNELKLVNPQHLVDLAQADVDDKQALLEEAELALKECSLVAPADGIVLRVHVNPAETLGTNPQFPAIQFSPKGPQIVRAEILQEWADRVKENQEVTIEDDTRAGTQWKGRVTRIGKWYDRRRHLIMEPFQLNDVRTLEAVVEIIPDNQRPLIIGQRVRVIFKKRG